MDINVTRKARSLPPQGCYRCGDMNHLVQDCPHCIDVRQLTSEQQEELIEDLLALKDAYKEAKLQARIKPTALCSAIDKENSIESPLDSATLYIQLLSWLYTLPPTVLMLVS